MKATVCHCWLHLFLKAGLVFVVTVECGCSAVTVSQNMLSCSPKPSFLLQPMLMRYLGIMCMCLCKENKLKTYTHA